MARKSPEIDYDYLEEIGRLIDKAENLLLASELPVRPEIHVEGLTIGLREILTTLREVHQEMKEGESG